MSSTSPGQEPTSPDDVTGEEEERTLTAESVLDEHQDLVQRLHQGDPDALVELLEAGGARVGRTTYKVTAARLRKA